MTLSEFQMHRPILGRYLAQTLEDAGASQDGWNITPRYEHEIRFIAEHPTDGRLVCVGPNHPLAMVEEEAPGCQGTWWWEGDLPQVPHIGSI